MEKQQQRLRESQYAEVVEISEEEIYSDGEGEEDENEEEESSQRRSGSCFGGWSGWVVDPKSKWVLEWNMAYLAVCSTWLFADPIFIYALSISANSLCLFLDGWLMLTVTVVRGLADAFHIVNMWVQYKTQRRGAFGSVGVEYKAGKFLLDLFLLIPIPQVVMWVVVPSLLRRGFGAEVMTVMVLTFMFQYVPKMYHGFRAFRRTHRLSGFMFGTVGWGRVVNVTIFFIASHGIGAIWYAMGIQRTMKCLWEQCGNMTSSCDRSLLICETPMYFGGGKPEASGGIGMNWANYKPAHETCLDNPNKYGYGGYLWAVQLFTDQSRIIKIIYPIFWSLMTICTMGNTWSTYEWSESLLLALTLTLGLVLMTYLISNIKVSATAATARKRAMQFKMQHIESWMKNRNLPKEFRKRVRNFERQRWAATRGLDETEIVRNLPDGLRRDIKYHLCLDLVRQVPLFQHMDERVLENICDRVKSIVLTKDEVIQRENDPVPRMLFIVRGQIESSQTLRDGVMSCCTLCPGDFSGDELLSWFLKRPFAKRFPPATATLMTLVTTECYALEAEDVKYITRNFRYTFENEKLRGRAKYYSPAWRTWAAVSIQLAWRRYKHREASAAENRLRLYAAVLSAPKPDQDDFGV